MIHTARKRIAIVGTGIAGLTAAYLLRRQHDVTVFEAAGYVGGHTNTVAGMLRVGVGTSIRDSLCTTPRRIQTSSPFCSN